MNNLNSGDIMNAEEILKDSSSVPRTDKSFTMVDKIAYFLMQMGSEFTAEVMLFLPQETIGVISEKMMQLQALTKKEALAVLEEFNYLIQSNQYIMTGGFDYAKDVLDKAFGQKESKKILDRLLKTMNKHQSFNFLGKIKPQQLAEFIQGEHPQTIAIVLSHMESGPAAETLGFLNEDRKIEVAIRMANLKDVSPSIIQKISKLLEARLDLLTSSKVELGGVRSVAEIFNRMGSKAKETLELIEMFDDELARDIKDKMFTFEDIIKIEDDGMMLLKERLDKDLLGKAIKTATEDLQNKFLDVMSETEKLIFLEEMEYLGKLRMKEVDKAQSEIVNIAQKMLEEEEIFMEIEDES